MSEDIVERLKHQAMSRMFPSKQLSDGTMIWHPMMLEAADEITRLREEIASAQRAAAAYEAWKFVEDVQVLTVENERLREENARLREALKPFAKLFLYPDDLGFEPSEDIRADIDWDEDANDMQTENVFVLRRDIRAARAAIREGGAK